jgi:hypothetical protein
VDIILYWLRVGLMAILAFAPPEVRMAGREAVFALKTERVLTEEMRELAEGGVAFGFELYCSLRCEDSEGRSSLQVQRLARSIRYDYVREVYIVTERGSEISASDNLDKAETVLARYEDIRFALPENWASASFFAELRPLDNPILLERFGKSGSRLWNGYRPNARVTIKRPEPGTEAGQ